jgi:hypothetical protein
VCSRPFSVQGPWQYYNGALFHRKYVDAQSGVGALVGDRPHHARLFQVMRQAVAHGTRLQSVSTFAASTPASSPAPHTGGKGRYQQQQQAPLTPSPVPTSPLPVVTPPRRPFVRSAPTTPASPAAALPLSSAGGSPQFPPVSAAPSLASGPPLSPALPWALAPEVPTVKPIFNRGQKKICKYWQRGNCTFGDSCSYAHGTV